MIDFKEWWENQTKDSDQWTSLERLAAKSAWEYASQQALYKEPRVSCSLDSLVMLQELLDASKPYLRRKKMTPRHECNRLNDVHRRCAELIKHNDTDESFERSEK